MSLHVHRSERTDVLADELASVLAVPAPDPFAVDVVAVPTAGVERFLSQRLAARLGAAGQGDGVCANVVFPSPGELFDRVRVFSADLDPAQDPWDPHRLIWTMMRVIGECIGEPWAKPVARYLDPERSEAGPPADIERDTRGRRTALATKLARLFHSYGLERPDMLTDWAAGRDTDGYGDPVATDLAWQPELWRAVREAVGVPSPAERLEPACALLRESAAACDLPARFSLFGPTRLPTAHLRLLAALRRHRQIHLWLPDPSPSRWGELARLAAADQPPRRSDSPLAVATTNPLLRSLGRDSGELRLRLGAIMDDKDADTHHAVDRPVDDLLHQVQGEVMADREVHGGNRGRQLRDDDRTVSVHACHGHPRQVEVLREVILGLLQDDPTLEPRDVVIMCPDVARFAPLITAVFGVDAADSDNPAHDLRVRIADRTPEQQNGVLTVLDNLLSMIDGRFEATKVLDFAALPAVGRAFGLDDDALQRLQDLTRTAGVRWGLDAQDRQRFRLGAVSANTWQAGLDRMLLGVAMSEDDLHQLGGVLPLDDVDDGDVAGIGRLAELVDRLRLLAPLLRDSHSLREWTELLGAALRGLVDPPEADRWQLPAALGALAGLVDNAGADAESVRLRLGDVRVLLADLLAGRPTRSNFRTGGLTVCSLTPMRSVPHRVICLLGLDDDDFPRSPAPDGDDVMARGPRVGERDRGGEERQLLIDAVMAATQTLVVVYSGHDQRTNAELPAAVPVGELLDVLGERERVVVRQPLQPFDARNFTRGRLGVPGAFSHDARALAGAQAAAGPRHERPPLFTGTLEAARPEELTLADLSRFLGNPAAFFLKERLGLSLRKDDEPPADRMPLELAPLERWGSGDRMLRQLLAGRSLAQVGSAELVRGCLPEGALGTRTLTSISEQAEAIATRAAGFRAGGAREVPVNLSLPSGTRLTGVIGNVYDDGPVFARFAELKAKHELELWVRLLALAASRSGASGASPGGWVFGRGGGSDSPPRGVMLRIPGTRRPADLLDELVDLYTRALRSPLPMMPTTSFEYARCRGFNDEQGALHNTRDKWEHPSKFRDYDGTDAAVIAVWGPCPGSFEELTGAHPEPDEQTWSSDEHTRFGAVARRVWDPVLAPREVVK